MLPRFRYALPALLFIVPDAAYAHPGSAVAPHDVWNAWSPSPLVLATLAALGACYALGIRRLWAHAGAGRGATRRQVAAYALATAALIVALVSPLDAVSESLFSAHMVQHLLLVLVAAPLIVFGAPQYVMLWTLSPPQRRGLVRWWHGARPLLAAWRTLRQPLVAWTLHVVTLWVWHVPRMYDAALRDKPIHVLEHGSFVVTAMLFWWVFMRGRMSLASSTFYMFAAALQGTLLGASIAMARHPWYLGHYQTTQAWGLTPLEDQQIAGLIMWVPAGLIYLLALMPRWARVLAGRPDAMLQPVPPIAAAT